MHMAASPFDPNKGDISLIVVVIILSPFVFHGIDEQQVIFSRPNATARVQVHASLNTEILRLENDSILQ